MNKGWVVVEFDQNKQAKNVEWFAEKFEAQDEADRLNEGAEPNTWYGWERAK